MKLFVNLLFFVLLVQNTFGSELDNQIDTDYDKSGESDEIVKYAPTWASLDSRPLPSWYDESKIGIFIHWGVFSVPSFSSEWFWINWANNATDIVNFMKANYPPNFTYHDFAPQFTTSFFNASEWAELFVAAGARYVVLTSKHHEGYTNWPSKYSFGWNSMDIGPKRDLLGELANAVRNANTTKPIHFGLYHSMFEWFNPLWLQDKANDFKTDEFVRFKTGAELYELVENYKPEVIWSDGDWDAEPEYWKSQEFLAWLYNESPVKEQVVVNDRWGRNTSCKHGGFYNCQDHYNPGTLQPHKWENAFTLDKHSWGYRRNAVFGDYRSDKEVITEVATTVACGGNVLINIGPTKDGTIAPIMQERLLHLGHWLKVNGDAIYETKPWSKAQNDSISGYVWYTTKPKIRKLYGIVLQHWGAVKTLNLGSIHVNNTSEITKIDLLNAPCKGLKWEPLPRSGIKIHLPPVGNIKTKWGWVFEITFSK